jgi:hypothetical protein
LGIWTLGDVLTGDGVLAVLAEEGEEVCVRIVWCAPTGKCQEAFAVAQCLVRLSAGGYVKNAAAIAMRITNRCRDVGASAGCLACGLARGKYNKRDSRCQVCSEVFHVVANAPVQ